MSVLVAHEAHLFAGSALKENSVEANLNLVHLTEVAVPAVHTAHFPVLAVAAVMQ